MITILAMHHTIRFLLVIILRRNRLTGAYLKPLVMVMNQTNIVANGASKIYGQIAIYTKMAACQEAMLRCTNFRKTGKANNGISRQARQEAIAYIAIGAITTYRIRLTSMTLTSLLSPSTWTGGVRCGLLNRYRMMFIVSEIAGQTATCTLEIGSKSPLTI